jgi:hypothetical protein
VAGCTEIVTGGVAERAGCTEIASGGLADYADLAECEDRN